MRLQNEAPFLLSPIPDFGFDQHIHKGWIEQPEDWEPTGTENSPSTDSWNHKGWRRPAGPSNPTSPEPPFLPELTSQTHHTMNFQGSQILELFKFHQRMNTWEMENNNGWHLLLPLQQQEKFLKAKPGKETKKPHPSPGALHPQEI